MQQVSGNGTYNDMPVFAHVIRAFRTNLSIAACSSVRLVQLAEQQVDGRRRIIEMFCFVIYIHLQALFFLSMGDFLEGEAAFRKREGEGSLRRGC